MSTLGTFDSFTTMRLGIYAAQQGLRVTGNNISNINTVGYTRQRIDQVSFKTGGSDRYASMIDKRVGNGVLVSGINQIRDPFLDIRYRNASNDTYHYDAWLSGMQDIAAILDEVGKGENNGDGLIYKQLQDLAEKLRAYSANPTIDNDRLVRESASSLTKLFHSAANRLDRLYEDTMVDFNNNITKVNEILYNIRDLDKSIRQAEIHGDMALELRDARNLQIDELSKYLDIKVEYSYEDVGSGIQVEKLTIKLNNANPDKNVTSDEAILVDGLYATQLSVPEKKPVLNTYGNTYEYLKGYTYLKKITEDEAQNIVNALNEEKGLKEGDEGYLTLADVLPSITEKDADGNDVTYYLVGTNDSNDDAIYTEENDNYTIQLDKLLNSKGEEWEKHTTTWLPVGGTELLVNQWTATIVNRGLADGDTFGVDKTEYTVVDDEKYADAVAADPNKKYVKLSEVKDSTALAKFVYDHYNFDEAYPDYNVTLDGDKIIFTEKAPGTDAPKFNDDPEDNTLFDVEMGAPVETTIIGPPEGVDTSKPEITYDKYGNKTTVNYVQVGDQWYKVTTETEYTREIVLDDNDTHGIIQAQRELLTEEGEFASEYDVAIDENALTKRGIPYYQKSLDLLAQKIAEEYNKLNQGYRVDQNGNYVGKDGTILDLAGAYVNKSGLTKDQIDALVADNCTKTFDGTLTTEQQAALDKDGYVILNDGTIVANSTDPNTGTKTPVVVDLDRWLTAKGANMGGVMFSNGNNGDKTTDPAINARNIDISYGWSNGKWNLVPTFTVLFSDEDGHMEHSTQNDNADHMLALIDKALTYNPRDLAGSDAIGPELFTGSFNDMFSNMMAVEAEDARTTNLLLNTNATILEDLDFRREGVSGVDLNDEAMNMVQYQKAMNAAMRLMTAIDEALERLINNTGIAGR